MFDPEPDITDGPISRALVALSIPLFVQNFVRITQQLVDLFWLGRLGNEAVAAVGLGIPIVGFALAFVTNAPYVGTQILVSQRVGRDDHGRARQALFVGLVLAVAFAVLGSVLLWFGARPLLSLLVESQPGSAGESVVEAALVYVQLISLGLIAAALGDVIEAAFVGWGDTRAALYINATALGTNILVDPVLIFGLGPAPALGIAGAALATVVGYVAGLVIAVVLTLRRRRHRIISRVAATFDRAEYYELLDVGTPAAVQQVAQRIVYVLLVGVVFVAGGPIGVAAYTTSIRVSSVAFVPARGLGQAVQSVVGQNLGADKPGRAHRTVVLSVTFVAVLLAVVGAIQWVIPELIAVALVPGLDSRAFELTVRSLRIFAFAYPALGAVYLIQAGFNGARRTRTSLISALAQYWGIQLPAAAFFGVVLGYGIIAVYWTIVASDVLVATGLVVYYWYARSNGMYRRAAEEASA